MGRVVQLSDYGGPYPGSFVPMLEAARSAVEGAERGWTFELVFSAGADRWPWYEELRSTGVKVRVAPSMGRAATARWLRSLLAEAPGETLLHTHFSGWQLPAAAVALTRAGTRVVWHVHTPLREGLPVAVSNTVTFGAVGRSVDRILCVGPEIYDGVRSRLAPPGRTSLFANAIAFDHFALARGPARAAARDRLGLPDDTTLLVTFAWDWERKGGSLFIDAVERLRARGRRVLGVPVVIDTRAAELQADARATAALAPLTTIDEVRDLYAAADVFVAASSAEGMPFSVIEALASGTPVIASDIASHRFIGTDLPTLRLAPRDGSQLAAAIGAEIDARETLEARASASRARLESQFSLPAWSERLGGLYRELLA